MISKNIFSILAFVCFSLTTAFVAPDLVNSGVYVADIIFSVSNGTSVPFVIYSKTGLSVKVDATNPIYPNSSVSITWDLTYIDGEEAKISLTSLKDSTLDYTVISVLNNGAATVE